jgi:tetratricopeptide (TPR) repeat protein
VQRFVQSALEPREVTESLARLWRAVEAVDLYKGDLLEDWDDEWCLVDREHLHRRFVQNLQVLARSFEARGRFDLALKYAQRAVDTQPLDESLQLIVTSLLIRTGRKVSAYSQFHRFARAARNEFGVDPDAQLLRDLEAPGYTDTGSETVGLAASLPALLRPNRLPLVGRVAERQAIGALLDAALTDGGVSLMLLGEAGIGKSRLVDWIREEWTVRGGVSGKGACMEFNEPIPYQPLLDALDGVVEVNELVSFAAQLNRGSATYPGDTLLPGVNHDDGSRSPLPRETLRLFNWLRERITNACQRRPLMVVVEDLHWVDAGTLDFLMYLFGRANDMPLVIVVTSRPDGRMSRIKMQGLFRHCTVMLRLDRLAKPDLAQLVRQVVESETTPVELASWLYDETEGNPLFAIETLRLLAQRGRLHAPNRDGLGPLGDGPIIPDGVRSIVDQRLALLEPAELRIAKIASVLGRSFDDELLASVAGVSQNTLSRYVGGLLRAGILEREGAECRFTHDKIRAVCYESLAAAAKRARHVRAAAVLTQSPTVPPHRLAWHQTGAGQWGLAAASWALAARRATEICAYEEAVKSYSHAIACLNKDDTQAPATRATREFEFITRSDEALTVLGRPNQRARLHDRMEAIWQQVRSPSLESVLCFRKAELAGHEGKFECAIRLARRAWVLARRAEEVTLEVDALRVVAWQLNRLGRNRRSLAVTQLALRTVGEAKTPSRAALLAGRAHALAKMGRLDAARASLGEARDVLRALGRPEEEPLLLMVEGAWLKFRASHKDSGSVLSLAERIAEQTGDMVLRAIVNHSLAAISACAGRLDEALRRLRVAKVVARTIAFRRTLAGVLNETANGIGRVVGNYEWAWLCGLRAYDLSVSLGMDLLAAICLDSQAIVLTDLGRYPEALCKIEHALTIYESQRGAIGSWGESLGHRGTIHLHLGNLREALDDLSTARQKLSDNGEHVHLVDCLTYLALAHARNGAPGAALATSGEALGLLEKLDWTNYQPQRIFWHHYQILEMMGREPRIQYLQRAVEFIDAQASTLSKAQARRLRHNVPLNRAILEAWANVSSEGTRESRVTQRSQTSSPTNPTIVPATAAG